MVQVTAFKWVPPFAQGSVRDLRVRWALEEAGIAYDADLIGFEDQASPDYRAKQPFGRRGWRRRKLPRTLACAVNAD